MLRRSLLSMLLGNPEIADLTAESAIRVDMPAYLKTDFMVPLVQQSEKIVTGEVFELQVSTAHPFRISWSFSTAVSGTTGIRMGITSPDTKPPSIALGLDADGSLYIGEIKADRRLTLKALDQQLQLLLEVHPQPENSTYAKLTLKDPYGLTLAMVKNRAYSSTEWAGMLINQGCLLTHFKVEGRIQKEI